MELLQDHLAALRVTRTGGGACFDFLFLRGASDDFPDFLAVLLPASAAALAVVLSAAGSFDCCALLTFPFGSLPFALDFGFFSFERSFCPAARSCPAARAIAARVLACTNMAAQATSVNEDLSTLG